MRAHLSYARRLFNCWWPPCLLAAYAAALIACYPAGSKADVPGIYELTVNGRTITLVLSSDGSFTETIRFDASRVEKRGGQWRWGSGRIGLDGLSIPKSFAPEYILRADSSSGVGQPKYTEPGYWSIMPERHWGTVVLPVFPGADEYFEKVQRLRP